MCIAYRAFTLKSMFSNKFPGHRTLIFLVNIRTKYPGYENDIHLNVDGVSWLDVRKRGGGINKCKNVDQ